MKVIIKYITDILNFVDSLIDYLSASVYYLLVILLYITYIVAIIGFTYIDPVYTWYLSKVTQIFIAIILMIRFNPLRNSLKCSENDKLLIFASAFYLLFNDEFTNFVTEFITKK
jgi:hypothetical protein